MAKGEDRQLNLKSWRLWIFALAIVSAFLVFYGWNLNSYVDGFSKSEIESVLTSRSIVDLYTVANAPYHALQKVTIYVFGDTGWGVRLPSLMIGLFSVLLFYLLIRQLTNRNITIFSTIMFAGASWMLNVARLGDPTITHILWPIAILLVAYNVYKFHLAWYWYVIAGATLGLASYTPRMIYFVLVAILVAIVVFHRYEARMHKVGALAGLATFIAVLTPGFIGVFLNPAQLTQIIGTPDLAGTLSNLATGLSDIAWKASLPDYLNLYNLALLNVVELGLVGLGLLVISTDIRAPRGWLIVGATLLSLVLIAVLPLKSINVHILLPLLSVLASIGLFTLWTRWREIFPKNQAARGLAIGALATIVVFSSLYHFERYYLGWSRVPETQSAFSQQFEQ